MATKVIRAEDMQEQISNLLILISKGDEIIIEKDNKPFAKLIPVKEFANKRIPGLNRGEIWVSEDFDEPLSDEFWLGEK